MDNSVSYTVEVNGLRLRGRHGVMPEERVTGNTFVLDIHLGYPFGPATETDDVADTLSYADVIEIAKAEMETPSALLEHVAGRIRRTLIEKFPLISGGMIRIAKLTPPLDAVVADCAVTIRWS